MIGERPLMRILLAGAGGLLAACGTVGKAKVTEIVTVPPGALVTVEGYGECTSPCTVGLDAPQTVLIAKEGFRAQRLELKPGKSRVEVTLELVAPTADVEEGKMDDL